MSLLSVCKLDRVEVIGESEAPSAGRSGDGLVKVPERVPDGASSGRHYFHYPANPYHKGTYDHKRYEERVRPLQVGEYKTRKAASRHHPWSEKMRFYPEFFSELEGIL